MIVTDQKKVREAEFTRQHTLNKEQFKKLLDAKMNRAIKYYEADRKQKQLCKESFQQSVNKTGNVVLKKHYNNS